MKKNKPPYEHTRRLFGRVFKVREWMDMDRMGTSLSYFFTRSRRLFTVPQAEQKEHSFEAAKKKFKLSDEQLDKQQHALHLWGLILFVCALLVLGVAIYFLIQGAWKAGLLSLVVTGIAGALAYRYHFLAFEIKQRKLGCSVSEWFREGVLGRKSKPRA